ncbi:hypothetical protein [Streptomyces sp. NPDC051569]|uniref:hypothetical protein n=1 Tax=Streptomyces sp. NPDC051569 TaxID=3365661 RepID=UPI00378A79DA
MPDREVSDLNCRIISAFRNFWLLSSGTAGVAASSGDSIWGAATSYRIEIVAIYVGCVAYPFTPLHSARAGRWKPMSLSRGAGSSRTRLSSFGIWIAIYGVYVSIVGVVGGIGFRGKSAAVVADSVFDTLVSTESWVLFSVLALFSLAVPTAWPVAKQGFEPGLASMAKTSRKLQTAINVTTATVLAIFGAISLSENNHESISNILKPTFIVAMGILVGLVLKAKKERKE